MPVRLVQGRRDEAEAEDDFDEGGLGGFLDSIAKIFERPSGGTRPGRQPARVGTGPGGPARGGPKKPCNCTGKRRPLPVVR